MSAPSSRPSVPRHAAFFTHEYPCSVTRTAVKSSKSWCLVDSVNRDGYRPLLTSVSWYSGKAPRIARPSPSIDTQFAPTGEEHYSTCVLSLQRPMLAKCPCESCNTVVPSTCHELGRKEERKTKTKRRRSDVHCLLLRQACDGTN